MAIKKLSLPADKESFSFEDIPLLDYLLSLTGLI